MRTVWCRAPSQRRVITRRAQATSEPLTQLGALTCSGSREGGFGRLHCESFRRRGPTAVMRQALATTWCPQSCPPDSSFVELRRQLTELAWRARKGRHAGACGQHAILSHRFSRTPEKRLPTAACRIRQLCDYREQVASRCAPLARPAQASKHVALRTHRAHRRYRRVKSRAFTTRSAFAQDIGCIDRHAGPRRTSSTCNTWSAPC